MSKGSKRRPEDNDKYREGYDAIFTATARLLTPVERHQRVRQGKSVQVLCSMPPKYKMPDGKVLTEAEFHVKPMPYVQFREENGQADK